VRSGKSEVRKNFFSMPVVKDWNIMQAEVKNLPTVGRSIENAEG
jgi:hypothetical protein